MTRSNRFALAPIAFLAIVIAQTLTLAQTPKPAAVDGTWKGGITTDIGQMQISVTLSTKAGVVTGEIANPHGVFKIVAGKVVDGEWVLPFETADGGKGQMKGKLSGETFTGDWDFHPIAVGTFSLKREK